MHVLIRADGGPTRGFGHLVRTSTVANQLVARGHEVTCLTSTIEAARSVYSETIHLTECRDGSGVDAILDKLDDIGAEVLIVDVPDVPLEDQQRLDDSNALFVLVRDDAAGRVCCDVLLNGHIYADADTYDWVGREPVWCVGGAYNVFNETIRTVAARDAPWRHPPEQAIVTMGGSDVRGTTPRAIQAFGDVAIDLDVIVGPGFTDETIAAIHDARDDVTAAVHVHRNPDDLAELMHRADFAVTALGLTAYELLAVGTPIIGTPQAPDQQPKAATLRAHGVAIVLDTDPTVEEIEAAVAELVADETLRRRFRQQGRTLVSVDGVDRFIDELERLVG